MLNAKLFVESVEVGSGRTHVSAFLVRSGDTFYWREQISHPFEQKSTYTAEFLRSRCAQRCSDCIIPHQGFALKQVGLKGYSECWGNQEFWLNMQITLHKARLPVASSPSRTPKCVAHARCYVAKFSAIQRVAGGGFSLATALAVLLVRPPSELQMYIRFSLITLDAYFVQPVLFIAPPSIAHISSTVPGQAYAAFNFLTACYFLSFPPKLSSLEHAQGQPALVEARVIPPSQLEQSRAQEQELLDIIKQRSGKDFADLEVNSSPEVQNFMD